MPSTETKVVAYLDLGIITCAQARVCVHDDRFDDDLPSKPFGISPTPNLTHVYFWLVPFFQL
jgi:hypothetical protein